MSTFVLDCSITMSWCFEDEASPQSDRLLDRLRDHGALVPALWFWEVANVLNAALRHGRVSAADVSARLRLLTALPISTDPDSPARAWRETLLLAQAQTLTVYDAAYLELAARHGVDLATTDGDLRAAALRVGVNVAP